MRAAIYCRVSTDEQLKQGSGLETQKQRCLEMVKRLGHDVPDEFIFMESWTGSTIDRPLLSKLRTLALQKKIDAVIVFSPDRLTRNSTDALILRDEFKGHGIAMNFVTDDFAANCESESLAKLLTFIFGWKDEEERKAISRRSMEGRQYWARMGRLTTGRLRIYGYNAEVRKYTDAKTGRMTKEVKRFVNENEAAVIRQIFEWSGAGTSLHKIAERMTASGLPSPRGKSIWHVSTVHAILVNELYTGKTFAFRYKAVEPEKPKAPDPFTGLKARRRYPKTTRKLLPRESWVEVPGEPTPQIIPQRLFEQVRVIMATHKSCPKPMWERYLLSGRVKCGQCGRKYWGAQLKNDRKGHIQFVYRCMGKIKANLHLGETLCNSSMISCKKLEGIVWEQIKRVLNEPEIIRVELEKSWASDEQRALSMSELAEVEHEIVVLREEEERLVRGYMKKLIDEGIFEKESKLVKIRKQNLEERKQSILKKLQMRRLAEDQIRNLRKFYGKIAETLDNLDQQGRRLAVEALDVKVTIYPDRLHIDGILPIVQGETKLNVLTTQPR